jgi:hypothetical protein
VSIPSRPASAVRESSVNGCFLEDGIVGQKSEPFGDGDLFASVLICVMGFTTDAVD